MDPNDRTPDPERLLRAYFHSTTTLNHIRGLLTSGFASLHHPRDWSLSHVRSPALREEFERITEGLTDALGFTRTIGFSNDTSYEQGGRRSPLDDVDFYTSHEGLMLDYEEALTRQFPIPASVIPSLKLPTVDGPSPTAAAYYNTSAHFLWIGDRTRQLDGAHVEYFRGIRNPIGIKVGPSMKPEELVRLLDIVNSDKESGRVTLITRYGAGKVGGIHDLTRPYLTTKSRSTLISPVTLVQSRRQVIQSFGFAIQCMGKTSSSGLKTRNFGTIISELTSCIRIHSECDSRLGGVSLEFTGELNEEGFSVTECLGGSMELSEEQLGLRYQSFCDPRLNFEQSLDVAFLVSNYFKNQRLGLARSHKDVLYAELGGRLSSNSAA
ncbi:hypothetical protein EUX98_g5094 [Antrodiella citrinella]|uniref:Phospho-2-dehydro-3-deoxyheptonate aldolase n=1 Tax=Antrodiella citrinella TaxID=2447956 RepID=A0A4V3XIG1_9APHY|nr:hypothetical protein EUX98_g5094 [Antrodiella citrinella]